MNLKHIHIVASAVGNLSNKDLKKEIASRSRRLIQDKFRLAAVEIFAAPMTFKQFGNRWDGATRFERLAAVPGELISVVKLSSAHI